MIDPGGAGGGDVGGDAGGIAGTVPASRVIAFSGATPIDGAAVRALAAREPRFDDVLRRCDALVAAEAGWSSDRLLRGDGASRAQTVLPYNFTLTVIIQIACFELLRDRGIDADSVLGMSSGEVSAAYAAGAIGLPDALRIALHGGRLVQPHADRLRMALVWLPAARCQEILDGRGDGGGAGVGVAAVMEPGVTALSGDEGALAALVAELRGREIRVHELPLPWGSHSRRFEAARAAFYAAVGDIPVRPCRRQAMMTSLGRYAPAGAVFDRAHWFDMFTHAVQFLPAVTEMIRRGSTLFIEAGPESAITHLIPRLGGRSLSFARALAGACRGAGGAAGLATR